MYPRQIKACMPARALRRTCARVRERVRARACAHALPPTHLPARTSAAFACARSRKGARARIRVKPSSSSHRSIRAFRAYPLVELRHRVSRRAGRGNRISVNSQQYPPPSTHGGRRGEALLRRSSTRRNAHNTNEAALGK